MNAPFKASPTDTILAKACVGISELKKNPSAVIAVAQEQQVAILNRNKPVAYLIAPHVWEYLLDVLDDQKLVEEALAAIAAGEETIPVSLDAYEVEFTARALKAWRKLDPTLRARFARKLEERRRQPRVVADRMRRGRDCYRLEGLRRVSGWSIRSATSG